MAVTDSASVASTTDLQSRCEIELGRALNTFTLADVIGERIATWYGQDRGDIAETSSTDNRGRKCGPLFTIDDCISGVGVGI